MNPYGIVAGLRRAHKGRVRRNALLNVLGWMIPLGANLLAVPFAVRHLGTERYGVFALILAVVGFLGLLELGLGNAVIKHVAEYAARGNWVSAGNAVAFAVLILSAIAAVVCVLLFFLAPALARVLLRENPQMYGEATLGLRVGVIGLFATMAMSPLAAVPQALQRYGIYNAVVSAFGAATAVVTVLVLAAGYGLVALVFAVVLLALCQTAVFFYLARVLIPGFRLRFSIEAVETTRLLSFGAYSLLGRVSYLVNTQLLRVLVGVTLGGTAVAHFTVTSQLVLAVAGIFASVTNVLVPAASSVAASADLHRVRVLLRRSELAVGLLALVAFACIAMGSGWALELLLGGEFAARARNLLVILAVGHFAYVVAMPSSSIALGLGSARLVGATSLGTSVVILASIVPLTRTMGLEGAGISVLLGGITALATPVFVRKLLRGSLVSKDVAPSTVLHSLPER